MKGTGRRSFLKGRRGLLGSKVDLLVRDDQLKPGVGAQKAQEITARPGWSPYTFHETIDPFISSKPREPGLRNRPDLLQRFLGV